MKIISNNKEYAHEYLRSPIFWLGLIFIIIGGFLCVVDILYLGLPFFVIGAIIAIVNKYNIRKKYH